LIFRLGDALLLKMAQPFLIDDLSKGGLALSTSDVGLIYGTVGTFFLFIGGILGGWLISKRGLRKCILPFALLQNLALPLYWYLAAYKPAIFTVAAVNAFEQFSYGLGTAGYTVFLMSTVKPRYKAAHYAIVTAFMALGVMLPGMKSGALESVFGYANFFLLSFALSLPGIIVIPFLPIKELEQRQAES
jgi:MFS transporter, PAT family, beta-lactamase induction signal transducer AmpG